MHVALLANTRWLGDELLSFRHLVVGLIDEQVRVTQVLPDDLPAEETSTFAERVVWAESAWEPINRYRLRRLAPVFASLEVELIHAMDAPLWHGAAALGQAIHAPVLLNVNAPDDLEALVRLTRTADPTQVVLVPTSVPLAHAIQREVDPAYTVRMIPPGVHPGRPARQRTPDDPLCAVVSGDGRSDGHYHALVHALPAFLERYPQAQFFFDGQGSDQHALWRAASELELLHNVSLIPRRLGHHELLVRADVLILPQPAHRVRALTLQAMANSVPVIAMADPWVDHLIDERTAWLVAEPKCDLWLDQLMRLAGNPAAARQLGERAVAWIRHHRLASQQVGEVLQLYRGVVGQTIRFPARHAG
ncbi:MAG: glycosyltransferase family 4 protein [Phycisphaeraceae bacterium]